jgi:serine protease AprX
MNGHTTPAARAATIAHRKGILVCNANGNYASDPWHYLGTPADADSILSVGATDYLGHWASFSSVGPSSDGRVKPDVADMGSGSAIARTDSNFITTGSGTSFATPELAGAAACLWQAYPNFTNYEIRQSIIQCANQYNNPDTLLGYGVPNFECSYSILTGIAKAQNHIFVGVFPNPFSTSASLTLNGAVNNLNSTLHIYNLLGQEVKSMYLGNTVNTVLTRGNLANGMYFYKLVQSNNQTVATGKFIVN